jgi:hypothetical protein
MFISKTTEIAENQQIKYELYQDEEQLRYDDFLSQLLENDAFRSFWIRLLREVPFNAYHWETPPVSIANKSQPFEFVVSSTPGIDLPPNYSPFEQYFRSGDKVAVFDNLGGDAKLVAPVPPEEEQNYSHIGTYTKNSSEQEQHALWQKVGQRTQQKISGQPLWLNTAGGGVAWLHVRLDSRPKYYRYQPYCD